MSQISNIEFMKVGMDVGLFVVMKMFTETGVEPSQAMMKELQEMAAANVNKATQMPIEDLELFMAPAIELLKRELKNMGELPSE